MRKKIYLMLIPLLMLFSIQLSAACAAAGSGTLTATPTANTCAGNGKITADFNTATNVAIQLLKGGSILSQVYPSTTSYTFSNLQPGTDYQIRTICAENNSVIFQTVDVTVDNNYAPITSADISISNLCTNFTKGATFTVGTVTGGNPPYTYAIVQGTDSSFDDATATYQSSPVFNVTDFGVYQIRVKDACGGYKTIPQVIAPDAAPIRFYWSPKDICGNSTQAIGYSWYTYNPLTGGSNNDDDYFPTPGIKLKIQDTNASGAVLFDGTYDGTGFTYTMSSSHKYWVTTTTACGLEEQYLYDLRDQEEKFEFTPVVATTGCGAGETETITINNADEFYWSYPVTVKVYSGGTATGTPVYTQTFSQSTIFKTTALPVGTYTLVMTDSCNEHPVEVVVTDPRTEGVPYAENVGQSLWRCNDGKMAATQTGTTQVVIRINGYVPDETGAKVVITSGPANVGIFAEKIDGTNFGWTNILPGNYTANVITSCGTYPVTFTVGNNNLLEQSITSTGLSLCSGLGTITSKFKYKGNYSYRVELLDSTGAVYRYNSTDTFINIPPGTYTTRLRINNCMPDEYYYIQGSTVTITDNVSGPVISSSVGVICEDADGNPLSTGTAYVDLNGGSPLTFRYREEGTSTWTTINDAPNHLVVSGLLANTRYEYELTSCGSSINGSGYIGTMGVLKATNLVHPCIGSPYALTIPYYSGATYKWFNSAGAEVESTRTYSVANWDTSYDGVYTARIQWSNCVTRYVQITVNSDKCGEPISEICYDDPSTTAGVDTKHGISLQKRAGGNKTGDVSSSTDWPMIRKSGHTVLESNTKGFVITRMASPETAIATPVEGMMVYDTDNQCLKIYDGTTWSCFTTQTCP